MSDIVSQSYFALYDVPFIDTVPADDHNLANFDNLTGGAVKVTMIEYDVIDGNGVHSKRYMPGQTTYEPVSLYRGFDSKTEAMYQWFNLSELGKLKSGLKNLSVAMIDRQAGPLVVWNLYNAIATGISGFEFNSHTGENYETFELDLQAERIEMVYQFS